MHISAASGPSGISGGGGYSGSSGYGRTPQWQLGQEEDVVDEIKRRLSQRLASKRRYTPDEDDQVFESIPLIFIHALIIKHGR